MSENERHPIEIARQDRTLEARLTHLESHVAMLWDHVWWMNLTPEKRAEYKAQGFKDPIAQFYLEG